MFKRRMQVARAFFFGGLMSDELLDADGLAAALGVKASTVKRWAKTGRIPMVEISRKTRRFSLADVTNALHRAAVTAPAVVASGSVREGR